MEIKKYIILLLFVLIYNQVRAQVVNKYGEQVLENVQNTSDLNKPISDATQSALDLKADITLSNLSNAASARTNLGIAIGLNVQAYNIYLADLADGLLSANLVENAITTPGTIGEVWTSDGSGSGTWSVPATSIIQVGSGLVITGSGTVADPYKISLPLGGTIGQVLTIGTDGVPAWEDTSATLNTYYLDADTDSYGDFNVSIVAVSMPIGYVTNNTDCDDGNAAINQDANEVCDGVDNNCDGSIDEGFSFVTYYWDADNDGYGSILDAGALYCLNPGVGYSLTNDDCDDSKSLVYPGAIEICDGIDNDCDGLIDEDLVFTTYYIDADHDGYGDINDAFGALYCSNPGVGFSLTNNDCDDSKSVSNPGAVEICDGLDNNCDGSIDEGLTFTLYYTDVDLDGYGDSNDAGALYCSNPGVAFSLNNNDCNDSNSAINPGIIENNSDGIDNNCDGQIDELSVGQYVNGGIVFYIAPTPTDLNSDGVLDIGLVCAIEDQGSIRWWKGSHVNVSGAKATSISAGSTNTDAIISTQGATSTTYAAGLAKAYTGGGYNDWFLPSKDALSEMYANQGFINTASVANGGTAFQQGFRWSSSQDQYYNAWQQWFGSGACGSCSGLQTKNTANAFNVRAVRAF
jgi:hypothetical protein